MALVEDSTPCDDGAGRRGRAALRDQAALVAWNKARDAATKDFPDPQSSLAAHRE